MYFGNRTLSATEAGLGRQVAIHLVYYAWTDDWENGDTKTDLAAGRIPLVNWEPDGIDFNKIVSGSLDATIDARAAGAKALGKPFFLDFAAESNGDEAWSGNDATLYVSAYRHIHDRFVAAGATNVVWAWCPNVTDTDGTNKNTMAYYPGDTYVDWTGVDGYNWGGTDWQSFGDVFADIYPLLAAKGKPILIGEMASSATGGDKAAWIDGIVPKLKASYPLIKGVVWFDVKKEEDWRIDSSSATLDAFKRFANDAYMNP
ncbi:MAG TPA: glycosyl hydrolase [Polyangiaceae bacterium]